MQQTNEYITLAKAAQITPGRPSMNCIWRWARRGVIARNGQRVKLQHIRIGGKVFTTTSWLDQFSQSLANADIEYFNHTDPDISKPPILKPPKLRKQADRQRSIEQAEAMLRSAGV